MAKEKAPETALPRPELQVEVARKKKKKRKDSDATGSSKGKKRPKFCPNSSKNGNRSFNLSRSRVQCRASETALKKNNEQLAKALNSHKITIGELRAELVLKDRRIQEILAESASLRLSVDPALVEAELLRRIAAAVAPIRASLEGAVDCLVQTSEHVTKGLQLASQPSRQSSISQARLSLHQPRHSSIGPTFRMRSVAASGSSDSANSSSPSLVSKVGPMVAGHAISRPRIQLTRMDEAAMAAARERQAEDLGLAPAPPVPQPQEEVYDPAEEEEYDDIGASPEHPGRSRFNMTNIVEESRLEESRLEVSGVLEEEDEEEERSPGLQMLPEEPVTLTPALDRSLQPMVRLSPCPLSPLEQATPSRYRMSVGRGITPRNQIPPQPTATTSQSTSSQPTVKTSLRRAPRPAAPPSAIRLSISTPSTPLAPPSPAAEAGTSTAASPFIPDNPSESFLEALAQDPGEGPSWLFADKSKGRKKKNRSSTARQLSALFSESERESGATTGASTSGMDTSDISLGEPDCADSSAEVSGFILAEDLRQSKSAVFSTAPSTPALAVADEEEQQEGMEEEQADVNKENSAEQESPSRLSISVSTTPGRRPLEEVAIDGGVVTYCPRLETGATVASLRTASIILKNVGTKGSTTEESTTPYRLSECYVAVSPGRSMSLDQLLSLGLRAGLEEGRSPRAKGNKRASSPGKRHQGNVGSPGKRMANSPGKRSLGNLGKRNLSGQENPLSKRARSCAVGRRIYSEEDPVEEEGANFLARNTEMTRNPEQTEKTNEEEAVRSAGLVGEGSSNLDRDEEETAAILEVVPEDGTDREVFMQAEAAALKGTDGGQRGEIEKGQEETSESRSRDTSRELSRLGRARNSVVYTESPVNEKKEKRMSKKEGVRRNPKSGRISPLDMNNEVDPTEEVLPKKKQSNVSNPNGKKVKEATSKKVSLVKAGGSKRTMDKGEQEEISEASAVEKAKDQEISVSRESSVGETEEAGTSRGRRARAQVSYALPSLNTKMRRNQ